MKNFDTGVLASNSKGIYAQKLPFYFGGIFYLKVEIELVCLTVAPIFDPN